MTKGDIQAGAVLHDVINILEPFFLLCHPQYELFFPTVNTRWLLTLKPVLQTEGRKKHQGERSGVYTRKANIFYKSSADFSLHVVCQSCVMWPLLAAREARKCNSLARPIAALKESASVEEWEMDIEKATTAAT